MNCGTLKNISRGCKGSGGIVEVYLGFYPSGSGETWYEETDGEITSISGVTAYTFTPNKNSSYFNETINGSIENSSIGYTPEISLNFSKNEAEKRNTILVLAQSNLIGIVKDKNNKYWLVGKQSGLEVTGGQSQTGTALEDMNGWNIVLTGSENEPSLEVQSTIIDGLLA